MARQALLKAVMSGRLTQTRLLLQMPDIDVNGRDVLGRTPLICALFLEDDRIRTSFLRVLLGAGAVVSLADLQRKNALMWACSLTDREDVKLLLENADIDLNINAQNQHGQTALWTAVNSGKVEVVWELLQALRRQDMNVEVADHLGVTPVMQAAMLGHLDCLRILIRHLDSTTKSRQTLLDVAKINKIFKALGITGPVKLSPVRPLPSPRPGSVGRKITPRVPTIRIISTDNVPAMASERTEKPMTPQRHNSLFSVEFLRDPARCSTPILSKRRSTSRCSTPQPTGRISPISFTDEPDTSRSPYLSRRIGVITPHRNRDHSVANDHEKTLKLCTVSNLSPTFSFQQGGPSFTGVALTPLASVRTERPSSVRDSLPRIFDIFAEQTSISFRKPAVKPSPPQKKRVEADTNKTVVKLGKGKGKAALLRSKRKLTAKS